jgi:prepilin-type N-terminal cleavage/methylation domain-containing protein
MLKPQDIRINLKTGPAREAGFTLVEVMIVAGLVGLLAAIAVPEMLRSRDQAHKNSCINNLKQLDYGIQQWALEQKKADSSAISFTDISPYLKGSVVCPAGGTSFDDSYTVTTVAGAPNCQRVPLSHIWFGPDLIAGSSAGGNNNGGGNGTGGGNSGGNGNGNGTGGGKGHKP